MTYLVILCPLWDEPIKIRTISIADANLSHYWRKQGNLGKRT